MPILQEKLPYRKKGGFHTHIKWEVKRAIGILRADGKTSLRALQDCIRKILYVDVSLGFIYTELTRVSSLAREINFKVRSLVSISHCTIDEVWIKVAKTYQDWNFGLVGVSPKSLFISFFDYVERRDEASIGTAILGYRQEGFNPNVLITDLLPTYRTVAGYFKACLHQLCTTHGRRGIARIIKDLPAEAKKDKFFSEYMARIKKRFCLLFEEDNIGKIHSQIGQIKRELKLFYTKEKREWAEPLLGFIERNSKHLFLYKKLPGKGTDNTNNAAEMVFSLFKPQYKIMKQFQIRNGTQAYFDLFTLRHNFRKFPRGKRKGSSPAQLEGLGLPIDDWSELIYPEDEDARINPEAISQYLKRQDKTRVKAFLHV